MIKQRRRVQGLTDLGKPQVPPLAQNLVMTGRDDGVLYYITYTGSAGSMVISVSTDVPTTPDKIIYGPFAGPYLNGNVRLYVTGGALAAEIVDTAPGKIFTQRVLARRANITRYLEVTVPVTWQEGDALVYTEVTV